MSCKKWEEAIYLYDELSAEEREQVDKHLLQCVDCKQLLFEVKQLQQMVLNVGDLKAQIQNPDQLTRKIMNAIAPEQKQESFIVALLNHVLTRYALTACSLVLVLFFAIEQQKGLRQSKPVETIVKADTPKVILNTNTFLKAIKEDGGVQMNTSVSSLYACIKTNQCDYTIVKYYKQKRQHENI